MKSFVFDQDFTEVFFPKDPFDNNPSIGLDNGLTPNRRQAIIWTNADPIQWRIYAAQGEMSFNKCINLTHALVFHRSDPESYSYG